MACACDQCARHAATLGLAGKAVTQAAVRKAFRTAARQWHPDRFENQPARRAVAEETFKQMQEAYRELWEHLEAPVLLEKQPEQPRERPVPPPPAVAPIFFGGLRGCFTAPHLPFYVNDLAAAHMHAREQPVAMVELSRPGSAGKAPAEFLFLTSYRILVRNAVQAISMLWYTDLGELRFVDQYRHSKLGFLRRIAAELTGVQNRYSLEIYRRNGTLFFSMEGPADDSARKVVYNFLRQQKEF
jgi:hypothetical protein